MLAVQLTFLPTMSEAPPNSRCQKGVSKNDDWVGA